MKESWKTKKKYLIDLHLLRNSVYIEDEKEEDISS